MRELLALIACALCFCTAEIPAARATAQSAQTVQSAQGESFGFDEIRQRLEIGGDQGELQRELQASGFRRLTDAQLDELRRLGARPALLKLLRAERALGSASLVEDVLRRAAKEDRERLLCWILRRTRGLRLTRQELRRMRDASLDIDFQRALSGKFRFAGYRAYRDPAGIFELQHPASWRARERWSASGLEVVLSAGSDAGSEAGSELGDELSMGVRIRVLPLASRELRGDALALGRDVVRGHRRSVPALLRARRRARLQTAGDVRTTHVVGLRAATQDFTLRAGGGACAMRLLRVCSGGLCYSVEFVAPRGAEGGAGASREIDAMRERVLSSFRPKSRAATRRRAEPLRPTELQVRYRSAVVRVLAHGLGSGTGFIAREDGLVLTNAHVVRDMVSVDRVKKATGYSVEIFDRTGPDGQPIKRRVQAELLDWVYESEPKMDMALLRLPRSSRAYPTIPMTPLSTGQAKVGDPVIALGFPGVGQGSLFLTRGSLTAIKRERWSLGGRDFSRLDRVTIDATIAPGKSGGPCIDLRTGGVIGLNTYICGDKLYSYSGVILIDHALARFPQLRWYPKGQRMSADQQLGLGAMLLASERLRDAKRELAAAKLRKRELTTEQQAELEWQLGLLHSAEGMSSTARRHRSACLKLDPMHVEASFASVRAASLRRNFVAALEQCDALERDAGKRVEIWRVRELRAGVYQRAGRLNEALQELSRAREAAGAVVAPVELARAAVLRRLGRKADALACLEELRRSAPDLASGGLAIAQAQLAEKDRAAAAVEYQKLMRAFPDSSEVLAARARFLSKSPSSDERFKAIDDAMQAVFVEWSSERSGSEYLLQAARSCARNRSTAGLGIRLARIVYKSGSASRRTSARSILASCWDKLGQKSVAALHRSFGFLGRSARASQASIAAMIGQNYSPELLEQTLKYAALDFRVDTKAIQALQKQRGYQKLHLRPILARARLDQMAPSSALGSGVSLKFRGKILRGTSSYYADITLTNNTGVPISEMIVQRTHYDSVRSKGKRQKVLLRTQTRLTPHAVFTPRGTLNARLNFDLHATLAKEGLTGKVKSYGLKVVRARNGSYLEAIRLSGRIEKGLYKLRVQNNSMFRLRRVDLACDYVHTKTKRKIIYAKSRRSFAPTTYIKDLKLDRGRRSLEFRVPAWPVNSTTMRAKGALIALKESATMRPRITNVVLGMQ